MIDPALLYAKIETHMDNVAAKLKVLEETKAPFPQAEVNRDIAIGIDLYQQYIDLLDEVKEKIENGEME